MTKSDLYRRARRSMLRGALLSPQSLSIILISLFGVGLRVSFLGAGPELWLGFGAMAETFFIGATLTDKRAAAQAVSSMFTRNFSPAEIKNPHARQRLEQALEYYRNMQRYAVETAGARRVQIESTVAGIDDWVEQIFRIAKRIDNYAENDLINRDRLRVPNDINIMRQRFASEVDSHLQRELQEAIQLKETQWQNLQQLDKNIKRADIQLDNTLSALGTIYTQLQLMDSKAVEGGRTQRIKQEINSEILALQDTIDAIDDVQSNSLYTLSAYSS